MSTNCIGYDNKAKTSSFIYIGVNGKARKCVAGYVGINGVARRMYPIISVPSVSGLDDYQYDGTQKEITITNVDTDYIQIEGITKATNAGNYSFTLYLKENEAVWEDGTNSPKSFEWSIVAQTVNVPTVTGNYNYNGKQRSAVISSYDSNLIAISGTTSATSAGTYTVTFSLKDRINYTWSDNTVADKDVTWKINKTSVSITVTNSGTCWYTKNGSHDDPTYALLSITARNSDGEVLGDYEGYYCDVFTSGWRIAIQRARSWHVFITTGSTTAAGTTGNFRVGIRNNENHSGDYRTVTVTYTGLH